VVNQLRGRVPPQIVDELEDRLQELRQLL